MTVTHYSSTGWLSGKLRPRLAALATALLLAPAAWAQIEVPAGNPNGGSSRRPLGSWFGYERSAMIYTAAEIGTSGNLTRIGFYVSSVSTPGATPTKIYLKTVTNATFATATTVAAEETGATLVYDATIPAASFTPDTWVSVPLSAPFAYNGTSNLEVIVETNATGGGNETSTGKAFRYSSTGTGNNRTQLWATDNTAPTANGALSLLRPNIQLTGLTPLSCPPVTGVTVSNITPTSAQISFTPGAASTSYTVTYTPAGGTATTVTPAPTASPISLTGLTSGTAYTVTITGNCAGSTTSPVATASFSTSIVAPANDNCATATALTVGTSCTPTTTTNLGATASTGVPAPSSSTGTGCFTATTPVNNDVWYSILVPASGAVTVTTNAVTGSPVNDTGLVLYTGTCGTLTEVACSDDATASNFFSTTTASGLTPGSTIYARVWSFGTTPTGQFGICAVSIPANDAAVQAIYSVGKAPVSAPQVVQAVIRNTGAAALVNVPVTLNVTGANTFVDAKIVPAIAVGGSAIVTFTAYTPRAIGANTLTVTLQPDGLNTNNTQAFAQLVTANSISYLDDSQPVTASVAVSSTNPGGTLAVKYNINSSANIGEVKLSFLANATTTSTYQVVVLNASATGTPGAVIFTSPTLNRPTTAGVVTVPITGVTVNGTFFVGLKEVSGGVGIGYQVENPLRSGTFYFQTSATGAWTDVNTTTLQTRLGIEVGFSSRVLSTNSPALARSISMFPNPSQGQVTLDIRDAKAKGAMQVQITNALGQVVHTTTVRDNAENKLDLSGLATGMYVLRVQSGSEYTIRQLVLTK
ncbi:T9SS type A sorting domain-containing protein [Hymenobacter puniceus]|uniref:T9SS type A sorting domain-containing protein n=1 Tax=Hymenobacter sp. BT190 TaxID=2763505 RepID=UPI001651B03E|nr:T9SS type A sorting domain-containing protein [Hymenobacter sp. BT190]MBC6697448.1 T9SS type A sorting domain-containing protein [Hymenobacter sp. BT190]